MIHRVKYTYKLNNFLNSRASNTSIRILRQESEDFGHATVLLPGNVNNYDGSRSEDNI